MSRCISDARIRRRHHGLQTPLHPLQVIGWLIMIALITGTFLLLIPMLSADFAQTIVSATFTIFIIVHVGSHLTATLLDPAEPQLRRKDDTRRNSSHSTDQLTSHPEGITMQQDGNNHQCTICNINVSGKRSKHCRACNKCVQNFDHHCKWLNQCVGERNYLPFLICMLTGIMATLLILIIAIINLRMTYSNSFKSQKSERVESLMNAPQQDFPFTVIGIIPSYILVASFGVIAAIVSILLMHLCVFHLYISAMGFTTYEFIKRRNENKHIKRSQKCDNNEDNERISSISKFFKMDQSYHNKNENVNNTSISRQNTSTINNICEKTDECMEKPNKTSMQPNILHTQDVYKISTSDLPKIENVENRKKKSLHKSWYKLVFVFATKMKQSHNTVDPENGYSGTNNENYSTNNIHIRQSNKIVPFACSSSNQ